MILHEFFGALLICVGNLKLRCNFFAGNNISPNVLAQIFDLTHY